jgi:hypothetical protein
VSAQTQVHCHACQRSAGQQGRKWRRGRGPACITEQPSRSKPFNYPLQLMIMAADKAMHVAERVGVRTCCRGSRWRHQ